MNDVAVVKPTETIEQDIYSGTQSLAVSLARAEVDQQVATARAMPRILSRVVLNIQTLATLDAESADECIYALPRGGKPIKGPSIRLAEIIGSQWGNARVGARVVHVDRAEKFVEAEGVFHDLETNMATTSRVRRRISDKKGELLSDDMIIVTGNAACAIAKRNAILGAVPKAVWRKAYAAVESVITGDIKTLTERREAAMKAFAAFGVTPEQVLAALAAVHVGIARSTVLCHGRAHPAIRLTTRSTGRAANSEPAATLRLSAVTPVISGSGVRSRFRRAERRITCPRWRSWPTT